MSPFSRKFKTTIFIALFAFFCFVSTIILHEMQLQTDYQQDIFKQLDLLPRKPNTATIKGVQSPVNVRNPSPTLKDTPVVNFTSSVKGILANYPYDVHRCPVCFGTSLCGAVMKGRLDMIGTIIGDKVLSGKLGSKDIVGKRLLENTQFDMIDNILCDMGGRNHMDNGGRCEFTDGIKHLLRSNQGGSTKSQLNNGINILRRNGIDIGSGPLLCSSDRLVDAIIDVNTKGKQLDSTERYQILMSLVLNPEGQLLKFFASSEDNNFPFPKCYGECGRLVVVENGGRMLPEFLSSSWQERVQIVLDIFNLLDHFLTKSDDWLILVPDINLGNFARAPSGDLILIDLEDAIVIDKKETGIANWKTHTFQRYGGKPCNMNCFTKFSEKLFEEPDKYCPLVTEYLDFQYAAVCLVLMSEYAAELELDQDKVHINKRSARNARAGGLLHDPPSEINVKLNNLVTKCITESVRGERVQAVNDLKDLLRTTLRKH